MLAPNTVKSYGSTRHSPHPMPEPAPRKHSAHPHPLPLTRPICAVDPAFAVDSGNLVTVLEPPARPSADHPGRGEAVTGSQGCPSRSKSLSRYTSHRIVWPATGSMWQRPGPNRVNVTSSRLRAGGGPGLAVTAGAGAMGVTKVTRRRTHRQRRTAGPQRAVKWRPCCRGSTVGKLPQPLLAAAKSHRKPEPRPSPSRRAPEPPSPRPQPPRARARAPEPAPPSPRPRARAHEPSLSLSRPWFRSAGPSARAGRPSGR